MTVRIDLFSLHVLFSQCRSRDNEQTFHGVRVGYKLDVIISYPTNASGIIALLKTPTLAKYREFFPTLFVKTSDFQLLFNFE